MNRFIIIIFFGKKEKNLFLLKEKEHFNSQEHIILLYNIYWARWPMNSEIVFYFSYISIKLTMFLCNTCIYIDKGITYINHYKIEPLIPFQSSKYLWNTYSVPGTVLGAGKTERKFESQSIWRNPGASGEASLRKPMAFNTIY